MAARNALGEEILFGWNGEICRFEPGE